MPVDSKRIKWFWAALILLPVLFFVLLELGLRAFNYGGDLRLFVEAPPGYEQYYLVNPAVARRYFFAQKNIPNPPTELVLKQKPADGFRAFVLGGSTAAGYPYPSNVMFSRILQQRLADAFPDKRIEVICTAMSAINSYSLLDFVDEILALQPDVLLIYAGHNEFYGALGAASSESLGQLRPFVKFYLKLQRFKSFILLRNGISRSADWLSRTFYGGTRSDPSATLMELMVREQTIPLGSPVYELGRRQFAGNLRDIMREAQTAGVPVVISELVSNIRDHDPFVSVAADSLPAAKDVFTRARALERDSLFGEAQAAYYRAKDLDALRFRATEEFNQIIHQVAAQFDASVVPMKRFFEQASPHGLPGESLFLEHLHPNVDGYFLMASAFFETLQQQGYIAATWDSSGVRPAAYYREHWGVTELDVAYGELRIRILKGGWPFKPQHLPNRALVGYRPQSLVDSLALRMWTDDTFNAERAHVQLAEHYRKQEDYQQAYREYLALVYTTPFNSSPYLHAAEMLIKQQKLDDALPLLHASLQIEETAYATKWLGQIYLHNEDVANGLEYLERATKMAPTDPQLLYNLSGAYALSARYEDARKTLAKLDRIAPNFPGAGDLKRQLQNLR